MDVLFTKADWGLEHLGPLERRLELIKEAGFDGIECFFVDMNLREFRERRQAVGLEYVPCVVAPTVEAFREGLSKVLEAEPMIVNCHGGRDYHSFDESVAFFEQCMEIADRMSPVQVVFETHRRCNLYSPWGTERLLQALPDLRICGDFSHFTAVSEGNMVTSVAPVANAEGMMDQMVDPRKIAMMDMAISRTDHIHARVGDLHRPQVADPRIGEGLAWAEHFELWWDRIIDRAQVDGRDFIAINPEYGPAPYAPCYPDSGKQISDHWELAVWAMHRLRARFAEI